MKLRGLMTAIAALGLTATGGCGRPEGAKNEAPAQIEAATSGVSATKGGEDYKAEPEPEPELAGEGEADHDDAPPPPMPADPAEPWDGDAPRAAPRPATIERKPSDRRAGRLDSFGGDEEEEAADEAQAYRGSETIGLPRELPGKLEEKAEQMVDPASRDALTVADGLLGAAQNGRLEGSLADVDKGGGSGGLGSGSAMKRSPAVTVAVDGLDALREVKPSTFLPRTFYFENTYLGGSAAYAERLRRLDAALGEDERPYRLVAAEAQPFDPPESDGLGLHASVDATHLEDPRRVFLQVGIQGSHRYGWRRPPVDAFVVLDDSAFQRGGQAVVDFIAAALRRLEGSDRLGVLFAGADGPEEILPLTRLDMARQGLAQRIDTIGRMTTAGHGRPEALAQTMARAGALLTAASESPHIVPGTQMVLVLSGSTTPQSVAAATRQAHALTLQGAVTSVFSTGGAALPWWQLADAGYGNWHRLDESGAEQAIDDELAALARVVARLIRVNVRLGKGAHAVRVLGTRVLEAREVARVKAREVAADRSLSKSMGITADRGEDDDGIQTVIPYFLGDDSHVILIELWVEEPGVVADVSLRYKDMVNLENAAARTSVRLGSRPQPEAPEQQWIARNVRGFMLGEALQRASVEVQTRGRGAANAALQKARNLATMTNEEDVRAVEAIQQMVDEGGYAPEVLEENLMMSGQRRVGTTRR